LAEFGAVLAAPSNSSLHTRVQARNGAEGPAAMLKNARAEMSKILVSVPKRNIAFMGFSFFECGSEYKVLQNDTRKKIAWLILSQAIQTQHTGL
jgi:hypothetical protein